MYTAKTREENKGRGLKRRLLSKREKTLAHAMQTQIPSVLFQKRPAPCPLGWFGGNAMFVCFVMYMYTRVNGESNVCVIVQRLDLGYCVIHDSRDVSVRGVSLL